MATFRPLAAVLLILLLAGIPSIHAQSTENVNEDEYPQLVVGIMVDQLRYDIIARYWDDFGDDGFRRLVREGFSFDNAQFDYAPTFTGPGHASVYTGTTPSVHGIIENRWFSRETGEQTYVTSDPDVETVGSDTDEGKMSPRYLLTSTIGDELQLHTNLQSQVIGVSLKDRGAILPAGHLGEAYWFDYTTGDVITSTYYHDQLPDWVGDLNDRGLVEQFLSESWEPLRPAEEYTASTAENPPEAAFPGQDSPDFPHDLPAIAEEIGPEAVALTPYGDVLVLEMAKAAIEGESLGEGDVSDLLAISFSSPDHVGHQFGPASREVQDTFLRLDELLADLLSYLDDRFGQDNTLVFLTADHGAAHVPSYLKEKGVPAGYIDEDSTDEALRARLSEVFGVDPVSAFRRYQVYLDRDLIEEEDLSLTEVEAETVRFLSEQEGIAGALASETLKTNEYTDGVRARMQAGFHARNSGDVVYWLDPQWMRERTSGTTHGSPYSYDTRAPLLWHGWGVPSGRSTEPVFITDIASTLAIMLNTAFPNGNEGNPMNYIMERFND